MSVAAVSPVLQTIEQTSINTIRTLSMDGVQAANFGHPGTPMAMAPVAYCLWQQFVRFATAKGWTNVCTWMRRPSAGCTARTQWRPRNWRRGSANSMATPSTSRITRSPRSQKKSSKPIAVTVQDLNIGFCSEVSGRSRGNAMSRLGLARLALLLKQPFRKDLCDVRFLSSTSAESFFRG